MQVLHWPLCAACDWVWRTLYHIRKVICGCTSAFVAHTLPVCDIHEPADLTVAVWVPYTSVETHDMAAIGEDRRPAGIGCIADVIVLGHQVAVVMGFGRHKLAINSAAEPTDIVVGVYVRGCPSSVDAPLLSRDCIGRTWLIVSPSFRCGPLSVIFNS
ncbi:unnamed protein product [Lactuca saligna]|uniref:Uncharacterized protein n=1 Tax=Lactuca saligna TaxID=75948 RepID=A0AA36E9F3_LACSI|nr:unnamed protein product [Lactuca saligna]